LKRLVFESAALALLVWGGWRWSHPPAQPATPTFAGERPTLAMPAAPTLRPDRPQSAMKILPEEPGRSISLGRTPALFSSPSPASPDDNSAPAAPPASSWDERLRDPRALCVVFAVFLVCWILLTRSLRRGPGGGGFTRD